MAATAVTLNSQVAGLFKCNPSNICAAFYMTSTDSVLVNSFTSRGLRIATSKSAFCRTV